MNKKMITLSAALLAVSLTGCANTEMLEKSIADLNNKVDSLSAKVNSLSDEHATLEAAQMKTAKDAKAAKMLAAEAADDAAKANERLDNVVSSYKK